MNYITVDHLAHITHAKRKKHKVLGFLREIKLLIMFAAVAFVFVTVFTNAQLFLSSFSNLFSTQKQVSSQNIKEIMQQDSSISSIVDYQFQKEQEVDRLVEKYQDQN
jgi:hypothetical protein